MAHLLYEGAFNINRGGYEGAYEVAERVLETRDLLAKLFHAESSRQVIFTPGVTWSLNMLLQGLLCPGDHVVVSGLEHNGVMRPLFHLCETGGISYAVARTSVTGEVTAKAVEEQIRPSTKLVLVLHASNVCGTILPIEEIGAVCRKHGVFFAVDTAQSAGTIPIDMQTCGIDFLAFTGHKGLKGPQGIGGFLISPKALSYLEETGIDAIRQKKDALTRQFLAGVDGLDGVRIIGERTMENRTAVVSVDFPDQDNALAAFRLEQEFGIMTRVGLHCAPLAHQSLGTFPKGTVRFSFSEVNTEAEIEIGIAAVKEIAKKDC